MTVWFVPCLLLFDGIIFSISLLLVLVVTCVTEVRVAWVLGIRFGLSYSHSKLVVKVQVEC